MDPRIYLFLKKTNKKTLILSAFFVCAVIIAIVSSIIGIHCWATIRYQKTWKSCLRGVPETEYVFVVVLKEQKDYLFRRGRLYHHYRVSTGSPLRYDEDRSIKPGLWRLNGREFFSPPDQLFGSRLIYLEYYDSVEKKFIPTTRAFHGTSEERNIGNPTSMGCVYHRNHDIIEIYTAIPDNVLVIVTES
jgi:hypothetical protein